MIPMHIGYDYTAFVDYMDPDVRCPKTAVKLNHPLTWEFDNTVSGFVLKTFWTSFHVTIFSL